jgi:hypothetical protein
MMRECCVGQPKSCDSWAVAGRRGNVERARAFRFQRTQSTARMTTGHGLGPDDGRTRRDRLTVPLDEPGPQASGLHISSAGISYISKFFYVNELCVPELAQRLLRLRTHKQRRQRSGSRAPKPIKPFVINSISRNRPAGKRDAPCLKSSAWPIRESTSPSL